MENLVRNQVQNELYILILVPVHVLVNGFFWSAGYLPDISGKISIRQYSYNKPDGNRIDVSGDFCYNNKLKKYGDFPVGGYTI